MLEYTNAIKLRSCFPSFRWHSLSLFCFSVAAIIAIILVVPARNDRYQGSAWWQRQCRETEQEGAQVLRRSPNKIWAKLESVQHGWPGAWLVRTIGNGKNSFQAASKREFYSWRNWKSWPFEALAWRMHPGFLLLDALFVYLMAFGVGSGIEYWLNRHDGKVRFSLRAGLVGVTLLAVLLGWVELHRATCEAEREVETHFAGVKRFVAYRRFNGPDWLAQLAGGWKYLPWMHHIVHVKLWNQKVTDQVWRGDVEQIGRLSRLQGISTSIPFPTALVDKLADARHLSGMHLHVLSAKQLRDHASLRTENLPFVDVGSIEALQRLKLKKLTINGSVPVRKVEKLLATMQLDQLVLKYMSVDAEELAALREKFPSTEIVAVVTSHS